MMQLIFNFYLNTMYYEKKASFITMRRLISANIFGHNHYRIGNAIVNLLHIQKPYSTIIRSKFLKQPLLHNQAVFLPKFLIIQTPVLLIPAEFP